MDAINIYVEIFTISSPLIIVAPVYMPPRDQSSHQIRLRLDTLSNFHFSGDKEQFIVQK